MTRASLVIRVLLLATALVWASSAPPAARAQVVPGIGGAAVFVRLDAYVTADGRPVTDLRNAEIELLEDGIPQRVESLALVGADAQTDAAPVADASGAASDGAAAGPVFVLFVDPWHLPPGDSSRASAQLSAYLDEALTPDARFGVVTPDTSRRELVLAPWAQATARSAGSLLPASSGDGPASQREAQIRSCYPDSGETAGVAGEMIARRRQAMTLAALDAVVDRLDRLRDERTFVLLWSAGWLLDGPSASLGRALRAEAAPRPEARRGGPEARAVARDGAPLDPCERERRLLASSDHRRELERLAFRANRANVSIYPLEIRAAAAPPPKKAAASSSADADASTSRRREALEALARHTDGAVIDVTADAAADRLVHDAGPYYLVGYHSTNTRLDGRVRRVSLRVKRPGVEVRTREGYLAATEAEVASARVEALMNGAAPGHTTIRPTRLLTVERFGGGHTSTPLRIHTVEAPGRIWLTGELDRELFQAERWQRGTRVSAIFEHAGSGVTAQAVIPLDPGQRVFRVAPSTDQPLPPGRYLVRLRVIPGDGSTPLQTTTEANVPEGTWQASGTGFAARRGPSTGLSYAPTADARFRRTERLRVEIPRADGGGEPWARLVGADGRTLEVALTVSDRADAATGLHMIVAEVTLAPLAQGEYSLEVGVDSERRDVLAVYSFRVVP